MIEITQAFYSGKMGKSELHFADEFLGDFLTRMVFRISFISETLKSFFIILLNSQALIKYHTITTEVSIARFQSGQRQSAL